MNTRILNSIDFLNKCKTRQTNRNKCSLKPQEGEESCKLHRQSCHLNQNHQTTPLTSHLKQKSVKQRLRHAISNQNPSNDNADMPFETKIRQTTTQTSHWKPKSVKQLLGQAIGNQNQSNNDSDKPFETKNESPKFSAGCQIPK